MSLHTPMHGSHAKVAKKPGSKPMSEETKRKLSKVAKMRAKLKREAVVVSGAPLPQDALQAAIDNLPQLGPPLIRHHSHYFKDVDHLHDVDVYRVLRLFNVVDPALAHAIKKLLVAGGRGAGKNVEQDVREAVDSCNRYLQMEAEDCNKKS